PPLPCLAERSDQSPYTQGMLHEIRTPQRFLSERERATLAAVAAAAIPAGRLLPGAGERTVGKTESFIAALPVATQTAIRVLLAAIDASAYASYLRPMAKLADERRLRVLGKWQNGSYARRNALRALLYPLKLAHYDDMSFYHALGCIYGTEGTVA